MLAFSVEAGYHEDINKKERETCENRIAGGEEINEYPQI